MRFARKNCVLKMMDIKSALYAKTVTVVHVLKRILLRVTWYVQVVAAALANLKGIEKKPLRVLI